MTEGKHVLLMLYWTNCDHCHNLMPGFENIAEVCAEANENAKPPGEPEIIVGRIGGGCWAEWRGWARKNRIRSRARRH